MYIPYPYPCVSYLCLSFLCVYTIPLSMCVLPMLVFPMCIYHTLIHVCPTYVCPSYVSIVCVFSSICSFSCGIIFYYYMCVLHHVCLHLLLLLLMCPPSCVSIMCVLHPTYVSSSLLMCVFFTSPHVHPLSCVSSFTLHHVCPLFTLPHVCPPPYRGWRCILSCS